MTKTIYVKDEDIPIFEEAEKVLGEDSLSAAISKALKETVERVKLAQEGWEKVELREYYLPGGQFSEREYGRSFEFFGKLLAQHTFYEGETSDRTDRGTTFKVFQTKGGKIVIWIENWSRWQNEESAGKVKILASLEEAEDFLPESLFLKAQKALGKETTIYIE